MKLGRIPKQGTTRTRKAFWDSVAGIVAGSRKLPGQNVSVEEYEGQGSIISTNPQREGPRTGPGACCIDGICTVLGPSECTDAGGNYLGNGTTCDDVDCTLGACCVGEGCSLTTLEECAGDFRGYGTVCDPNPCAPTHSGACCKDGDCSITTALDCASMGGSYQGNGTTCDGVDCTQGACCDGEDCSITTEAECNGTYQGDGTTCDPNPCEVPGCNCDGFTNPLMPGRIFLSLSSDGIVTVDSTATCDDVENCSGAVCLFQTTCTGTGAHIEIDPVTCEITETFGTWNSINTARSTCECADVHCIELTCVEVDPQPPASGTYHAESPTFCGLGGAGFTFTLSGTTVHGHFVDHHVFDLCNEDDTYTYDVFYHYSNECMLMEPP